MRAAWRWALIGLAFAVTLRVAADDARPPLTLLSYHKTSWFQQDGAPADIQRMARTGDGWLWLGTPQGVFRFDGLTFEPREVLPEGSLHSRAVAGLLTTVDDDLWIFFATGGAAVLRHGQRDHAQWTDGLPDHMPVRSYAQDAQGHPWALVGSNLYREDGGRWHMIDTASAGLPADEESSIDNDPKGNIWYMLPKRLLVSVRGSARFSEVAGHWDNIDALGPLVDGKLVVMDERGSLPDVTVPLDLPTGSGPVLRRNSSSGIMSTDTEGVMWSVACVHAQLCIAPPGSSRGPDDPDGRFDPWLANGELQPGSMCVLSDDEGNTWVGTKRGLVRFRRTAATSARLGNGYYYFAVVPRADGSVLVGTDSRGIEDRLWLLGANNTPLTSTLPSHPVSVAWREGEASAIVGGVDGFWRIDGTKVQAFDHPLLPQQDGLRPQSMARDSRGQLWIAYSSLPPWRLGQAGWQPRGGIDALPSKPVLVLVPEGDMLWMGYRDNSLVRLDAHDRVTRWGQGEGLATGTVTAMLAGAPMWVGGERGVQWFDGKAFHSLHAQRDRRLEGVTGLLRDADGSLWVNGQEGLVHFSGDEVQRAMSDPAFQMSGRLYDEGDGVDGTAQQSRPLPTLTRGSDGRIWVASTNGLSWLDPQRLPRNTQPPKVDIGSINGQPVTGQHMHLAAGTKEVRVAFRVLSLVRPDRTTVRYRLKGAGNTWIDAGSSRQSVFNNIGPGDFRFELMAANEDGVWNNQGADLTFTVEPTFFQTPWFKAICAVTALALLWLAFVLRLRHERKLMRQKMSVRHAERERIARELHDTLLQGISGILMRMQVWMARSEVPDDLYKDMARANDQAHLMLCQGRDRIAQLRADDGAPLLLAAAIRSMGESLSELHDTRFEVIDRAPGVSLRNDTGMEVLAIVREAMANALAHSGGQSIIVTIDRRETAIAVTVADDGCGIPSRALNESANTGHWGLVGMRERARKIGATLSIIAAEERGTHVTIGALVPLTQSSKARAAR